MSEKVGHLQINYVLKCHYTNTQSAHFNDRYAALVYLITCTVDSVSGISLLAGTRETSVGICAGCSRVTTSVVPNTLVDICVNNNIGDE